MVDLSTQIKLARVNTTPEVAAFLGISADALEKWRSIPDSPEKPKPAFIRRGHTILYREADVLDYLKRARWLPPESEYEMNPVGPFLNREQVAELIHGSVAWFEKGLDQYPERLPPAYRIGRRWRYSWPEVEAWLKSHRVSSGKPR